MEELQQAKSLLDPLLGNSDAGMVFALALLMAGISSTITSGMAAGSIFAGIFGESYHIKDSHSQVGLIVFGYCIGSDFLYRRPVQRTYHFSDDSEYPAAFTVFLQVGLTSSKRVMGNMPTPGGVHLCFMPLLRMVTVLNIMLLVSS